MSTFANLKTGIALRCHDTGTELSDTNYGVLINQAVDDLAAEGIVLPLAEDESLTLATDDWQYDVPASFAYIKEIRQESAVGGGKYPNVIHPTLWRLTIETSTTPVIQFDESEFGITNGVKLKIVGQKRVAQLAGTEVAPPGLESFIRERALSYACDILAGSSSQLSAWRRGLAEQSWGRSLDMLRRFPRQYRPWPDSVCVPER